MGELDYAGIGSRIRQIRKAKGWSQDGLAKKCGISTAFLGRIERGERIMSLETFANLCGALGTDADGLLWGKVHPSGEVSGIWDVSGRKKEDKGADSYSMYVRIMKSVAEIMNGT